MKYAILLVILVLTGCANGPLNTVSDGPSLNYEMVGIPILYQGFGTSVPITKDLSITAAHVAKMNWTSVVSYHPTCDIAIIRHDNSDVKTFPSLGLVHEGETVITYGKDGFANVLSGRGKYYIDLNFTNNDYFRKCNASITDAPIREGMSGGAVMNDKGQLVGIIAAMANEKNTVMVNGEHLPYDRLSLFVSLNYVRDWIKSVTGIEVK